MSSNELEDIGYLKDISFISKPPKPCGCIDSDNQTSDKRGNVPHIAE